MTAGTIRTPESLSTARCAHPEYRPALEDYFDSNPKSPDHTYGRRGGFISPVPFNPMEFNIPPNILEAIDTSQLLGLVAAGQALKDAGYGPGRDWDRDRASVILGVVDVAMRAMLRSSPNANTRAGPTIEAPGSLRSCGSWWATRCSLPPCASC